MPATPISESTLPNGTIRNERVDGTITRNVWEIESLSIITLVTPNSRTHLKASKTPPASA